MPVPISLAAAELGSRLRERRKELGGTQELVAEHSGVDVTTVRKIELGVRNPNLHNLIRLAHTLNLDVAELVKGLTLDMIPEKEEKPTRSERMERLRLSKPFAGWAKS